ncbi:MAG TPA: HPr family phosphocarrier protein [Candidatus Omnitrophota bacterium]|nr:HPr family phosphocarrier protein [Candidatus Omnitrophota bacterium]HPS20801.1 HPr family phosphocarrier protein [Candidatus Omnitrophota bacterium]
MKQVQKEITVKNKMGLHARPAAVFVQVANKFISEIKIIKDDQEVNGKSIMGILMLAAERGAKLTIIAKGDDAEEAMARLCELLDRDSDIDVVKS